MKSPEHAGQLLAVFHTWPAAGTPMTMTMKQSLLRMTRDAAVAQGQLCLVTLLQLNQLHDRHACVGHEPSPDDGPAGCPCDSMIQLQAM